jgi:acyl carrier protein
VNDIRARLTRCFAAVFPQIAADQLPTLSQDATPAWDSVATATLMVLVEEEFGITMQAEDLEHLESFNTTCEYLSLRVPS